MSRGLRQRLARGAADRNGSREEAPGEDCRADQAEQRKHSAEPAARESKRHALPDQRRSACGGPEPAVVCPDPGGSLCHSQKSGEKERSTDCTHRQCGHFFLRIAADEGERGSILFFHARSPLKFRVRKAARHSALRRRRSPPARLPRSSIWSGGRSARAQPHPPGHGP